MEKIHFTVKAANYIKGKYFTSTTEIHDRVKEEEINEPYVDVQTSAEISSRRNSIVEETETLNELHNCILIPSYASRVNENTEWLVRVRGWAYGTKQTRKKN